jgi:hypothetical protein
VTLLKGIVHFVYERDKAAVSPIAVVYTDRIECVSQYARHRQQQDLAVRKIKPGVKKMPFDLSLQGLPLSCPVINVSNAERIEAVV